MKNRPVFVWFVSFFYFGLGLWSLLEYDSVFFQSAWPEMSVMVVMTIMYFIGAISLLLLKKFSLPIFILLFLIQIGYIYYFHPSEIIPLVDNRWFLDIPISISLQAASFIYVWSLNKRRILS